MKAVYDLRYMICISKRTNYMPVLDLPTSATKLKQIFVNVMLSDV